MPKNIKVAGPKEYPPVARRKSTDIVDSRGRRRNTTLAKVLRFLKSKVRKAKEKV